jgi:hypothetical protein
MAREEVAILDRTHFEFLSGQESASETGTTTAADLCLGINVESPSHCYGTLVTACFMNMTSRVDFKPIRDGTPELVAGRHLEAMSIRIATSSAVDDRLWQRVYVTGPWFHRSEQFLNNETMTCGTTK